MQQGNRTLLFRDGDGDSQIGQESRLFSLGARQQERATPVEFG